MITGKDLVEKLYSEYEEEERTYSVEMDEETLSLFSDFCEEYGVDLYQKSFGVVKATNKAAKRAWEIKQGKGNWLKRLVNGNISDEQALVNSRIARDRRVMDATSTVYESTNGKRSYKNLNTKINNKGVSNWGTLSEGKRRRGQYKNNKHNSHMDSLNQHIIDAEKKVPTRKKLK